MSKYANRHEVKTREGDIVLECPTCGPPTRFSMKRSAYKGGTCVGHENNLGAYVGHKPQNYVEVKGTK